ncbi:MAG TPA: tetratricopeptide repeat protein [Methylovirgula sp.]|nr:tetratricopeptide repeat protein [Methylovirgula sp.]
MQIELPAAQSVDHALAGWRALSPSLDDMLVRHPPHQALRQFGLTLWAKGEAEAAIGIFKSAIALAPHEAALWSDLAGALYTLGRTGEARTAQHLALERDPTQAQGWLMMATLDSGAGDLKSAESFYLTALRLDPNLADASFGLGVLYFQQRRFDEAIAQLRKAMDGGGKGLGLFVCLGQALFLTGDFSGAIAVLTIAARSAPGDGKIAEKLARLRLIEAVIHGSAEEAIAVYRQAAGPHADDIDGVTATAFHFLSGFGHREAAIKLGRARLERKPDDPMQAYLLAALEKAPLARAPDDYLAAYFDNFADGFESKLVDVLNYRVPEELAAILAHAGRNFENMLDLGCGTGLSAPLLRPLGAKLTGVDLSPRMLAKAAARGLYDRLIEQEVGGFLCETQETYDLIVAADLLVYFGDLQFLFASLAKVMRAGGLLAFNVETTNEADFLVLPSGRFAHARDYIERLAGADFTLVELRETTIRLEANSPVAGLLVVFGRR